MYRRNLGHRLDGAPMGHVHQTSMLYVIRRIMDEYLNEFRLADSAAWYALLLVAYPYK